MDAETYQALAKLSDEDWTKLVLKLGHYAASVSRRLRWRTRNSRELPGGETVESIVSKAIEKLFSGDRRWDPRAEPDLEKYLMDVIDSLLSHLVESQDNKLLTTVPETAGTDEQAEWEAGPKEPEHGSEWLARSALSPETALLESEQKSRDDRALEMLIEECSTNPVLTKVLEAMFDGHDGPAEIARATGLDRKDIYNAAKRLDRKIALVRERLHAEEAKPPIKRD